MLFLLPPSETKRSGGGSLTIDQVALTFGGLNGAREVVMQAAGAEALLSAPTMRAIDRYTGTLYGAIHGRGLKGTPTEHNALTSDESKRAKQTVLIQSAMFGLIPSTDHIPEYKISPSKNLGGLNLKQVWSQAHAAIWPRLTGGIIIDLRSKAYADLAPIPAEIEHYTVTVEVEYPDGSRRALNHFNKKAKGQLVRAALTAKKAPESLRELKACAKRVGLTVEVSGRQLTLVTREAT
ncbi:MAG: peroxide stress protein YaaA [Rhodoluna sp.]